MLTLFLEGKTGYFSNSFPTNKKTNMKLFLVSMAPKGKASEKQPGYFSEFFLNSEPHPPTHDIVFFTKSLGLLTPTHP